jgi:hypothetical protein
VSADYGPQSRFKCGIVEVRTTSIIIAIFAFGCGGDPYAGKYATTKPHPEWFVGEWVLETDSPGSSATKQTKLILRSDESFKAVNYPGEALDGIGTAGSFYEGEGTWSIGKHQWFWVVQLRWRRLEGNQLDFEDMLNILNDTAPHVLHAIIDDADEGKALVLVKPN